ncbi:inosose dehydratase [Neobacillus niacini]|uniref:sugar phosphate isomerase/epimerase family protein n=1 Tax=Neobacillus driksii TaxID=3035913 RepID=UPI00277E84ED|nr:sugar phosphate isomerase/epimerase [Neobacillus niacini]MDQ0972551.1 inosose dehydratase [Neobacillus niacini]
MNIKGFSSNMYGWVERWKKDNKQPRWEEIFSACAEAGLDAVEIDADHEKLKMARSFGLAVSASYVGLPLHVPFNHLEFEQTVLPFAERLASAGGSDLLLNADPINWKTPAAKTEDDFKQQGENLAIISEIVKPMSVKVCLHNHAADHHNANGDLRSVIDYSDQSVGLCVDMGWAHVAGCNPIEWVNTYPERIFAFHFRNQNGKVPTEDLLDGEIDITAMLKSAAAANYNGWLALELWHPPSTQPKRTMTEDVKRSISYLKELIPAFTK